MIEIVFISLLNGILYSMLLFLMASGLTVIFSMMGVVNFAHASFYMLGAFFGFQVSRYAGFWTGLFVAPLLVTLIGMGLEHFGLRRLHKRGPLAELLFAFGLTFIIQEVVEILWGKLPVDYKVPHALDFPAFTVFSTEYPAYKLFEMLVAILIFLALLLVIKRTRIGLVVQAALDHPEMVAMLGHNVDRVFMFVFGVGVGLAAVAGVIAGPALVTQSDMAAALGPLLFVVVVIGGLGSLTGAFIASLLIGLLQTFAVASNASLAGFFGNVPWAHFMATYLSDVWSVTVAQIAPVLPYLLLVLMLIFRPRGLMGTRE